VAGSHLEVSARPARRSFRFVAGLVLIAVVWFVFLRGGGSETAAVTLPSDVPASIGEPVEIVKAQPKQRHKETYEVFAPKDPFESLVSEEKGKDGASGGGKLVSISSVSSDGGVVVNVDGTDYVPEVGGIFAQSFQLVSVDGDCTALLYGDDQFSLCEGQEITK
jgi:hypothetical protein